MTDKTHSPFADELEALRREIAELHDTQTQRDMALEELRESEKRYRHLIDHANDIIYNADRAGYFTYFNPTATRLLGYSEDEIHGRLYLDLIHPDYRKAAKRFYVRQLRERILNTYYEYPAVAKDGRIVWLGQNVQLVVEHNEIYGIQAIARDITERRLAETRLQRAYAELERRVGERTAELSALNTSLQAEIAERQAALERERRFMEIAVAINASQELDEILRLVRDAIVEIGGFDRAGMFLVKGEVVYGAWGTDFQGNLEDEHGVEEKLYDWGPYIGDLVSGRRKFYIEELFGSSRPADAVERSIPHAVVALRADGELVGLLSVDNLLTCRPVVDKNILPLLPFAEQAAAAIRNARLLTERARHLQRQRRLTILAAALCASTTLHETLRMVRDAIVDAGGFDRAGVFLFDQERSVIKGTWGTDRRGNPEDISYEQFLLTPEDPTPAQRVVCGELDYYLTTDLDREVHYPPDHPMTGVHAYALVPLRAQGVVVGVVAVDNLLSDTTITEEDIAGLLPFADLAAVAIQNARLFEDLRHAQDALIRSEKLRAMGELASGVAHNVNNMLAAVLGYAELIQGSDEATAEVQHYARTIERAAMDGAEIVRRMQRFSRIETEAIMTLFNLSAVAQDAVDLTRPAWHNEAAGRGAKIDVKIDLEPEIWVLGVDSEIREVVVNLIKNAADAMQQGGVLTINGFAENGQAILEIGDTGHGMDEQTRQRVFEPFYTTKEIGKGVGLGLSVAWGIMTRHHGSISVQSAPQKGSIFRIALPLAHQALIDEETVSRATSIAGAHILVVDDEENILGLVARMLTRRGAIVSIASNAAEAQDWLADHAAHCDVVLSDHGMVGLTGLNLLAQIRERYPHIARVLLSGWGANVPGGTDTSSAELILTKPIRQDKLIMALSELLSARAARSNIGALR